MSDKQLAYDFIEDGSDKVAHAFYDFCWDKFRNQMRTLIEAYVASDGEEAFNAYLARFENGFDENAGVDR